MTTKFGCLEGEEGQSYVDACGRGGVGVKNLEFLLDIINGWPLIYTEHLVYIYMAMLISDPPHLPHS